MKKSIPITETYDDLDKFLRDYVKKYNEKQAPELRRTVRDAFKQLMMYAENMDAHPADAISSACLLFISVQQAPPNRSL